MTNDSNNPYLNGRREFLEVQGDLMKERSFYRMGFFIALAITGVSVCGNVIQGTQSKVVPYMVDRDKLGATRAIERADVYKGPTSNQIRHDLVEWVTNVRTVYIDAAAARRAAYAAYSMVQEGSAAKQAFDEWYAKNDPRKRAESDLVTIEVDNALQLTPSTWRVEWRETTRSKDPGKNGTRNWAVNITFDLVPPHDEASINLNPNGIWITQFGWSQRL
jgi:type IV secretion system protein VirB5